MEHREKKPLIAILLCIAIALASFTFLGDVFSDPNTYQKTISSLDEKRNAILGLTAATSAVSVGMTFLPTDVANPVAENFADFADYFLLVLTIVFAEKYLLTIIGAATFKILIPLACAFFIIAIVRRQPSLKKLARKLFIFGLIIFIAIPASMRVSDMIYDTYKTSLAATLEEANSLASLTSNLSENGDDDLSVKAILNTVKETASSLAKRAADLLNRVIEAVAVFIVTTCVIPVLVVVFFLWLVKLFFGLDIEPVLNRVRPRVPRISQAASEDE